MIKSCTLLIVFLSKNRFGFFSSFPLTIFLDQVFNKLFLHWNLLQGLTVLFAKMSCADLTYFALHIVYSCSFTIGMLGTGTLTAGIYTHIHTLQYMISSLPIFQAPSSLPILFTALLMKIYFLHPFPPILLNFISTCVKFGW